MSVKISIITVVYNGEKFLEETIKSVVAQEYNNYEYIIVDGKSTDGTLDIIKKYENNISKWISEPDNGLYHAMNKSLGLASGEYLLFLNAGDKLDNPNVLSNIFEKKPEADIIYSDTMVIDQEGKQQGLLSKLTHNNAPKNLCWKSMQQGMVVCHQSFMVKKDIATPFDLSYSLSSDIDWVIKCLKKSQSNYYSETIISNFMSGGLSKKHLKKAMKERYHILKKHFGFFLNLYNHFFMVLRFLVKGRKSKVS
jgi:glycosyltransferase involved in cell wall biosynthesis